MKGRIFRIQCTVLFCLAALLPVPVYAASYVDDMTDLNNSHIKTYSNLAPVYLTPQQQGALSRLPDLTMHTFASTAQPKASVTYRVQGAGAVKAGIYTQSGAFVAALPGENGRYSCGPCQENLGYLSGQQTVQAQLSPSRNGVYTQIDGVVYKAVHNGSFQEFFPAGESPGDLVGYGVNVYASADGSAYSQVRLRQSRLVRETGVAYVYEEYRGSLPAGTRYVRVEINDTTQRWVLPQGGAAYPQPRAAGTYTSLASVTLEGENLVLGAPEEMSSEPDPVTESRADSSQEEESGESSSKKSSSSSKAAAGAAAGGTSGSAAASSKFEGVITSMAPSAAPSRAASRSGTSSKAPSAPRQEETPAAAPTVEQQEPVAPVFYEVQTGAGGSSRAFTAGVAAYLAVVAGAIVFLLLRKR